MGIKKGDTISSIDSLATVWQGRISGLNLFNLVKVRALNDTLQIDVLERYYSWVKPYLQWADRNFNVWWQSRDPSRLIYGGTLYLNNLMGLNHKAWVTAIRGYNHSLEAGYQTEFNRHDKGIAWWARGYYWTNHELWYTALRDTLRFLEVNERPAQRNAGAEFGLKERLNYFNTLIQTVGYNYYNLDTSLKAQTSEYLFSFPEQNEFFLRFEYIRDLRNQRDYPSNGSLLKFGIRQAWYGKGSYGNAWLRYSGFLPVRPDKRLVLATLFAGNINTDAMPYRFSRQLGYQNDYVRGYEPYVSDGRGFVLGRSGLRYAIFSNKKLVFMKSGRFFNYAVVPVSLWFNIFADAGRVIQPWNSAINPLSAQWQRGLGAGVDLIAWYSAMARFEFSINHLNKGNFNLSFRNAF